MRPAVILLVEDNPMDLELIVEAFKEARLANRIEVVKTGEQALDYLHRRGEFVDRLKHPLPDLILLDLKLPGISGFEVLRHIKGTAGLRRLPVVILTSSRDEGDRAMGYENGVNSYLVKPVSFDDFVQVVRQVTDYWMTLNVGPPKEDIEDAPAPGGH